MDALGSGADYATAARRAFPFLTIDFWKAEGQDDQRTEGRSLVVPLEVVVKFLMKHLKLDNKEIVELRHLGGPNGTWKVKTREEIIVEKRFEVAEFEDEFNGRVWRCSIRGGMKKPKDGGPMVRIRPPGVTVKIMNPPEEVPNHEIAKKLMEFGDIGSSIKACTYRKDDHPWLEGILNGNKSVLVRMKPDMEVPRSIMLRGKKVRLLCFDGSMKCYGCGKEGHKVAECPGGGLDDDDDEENTGAEEEKGEKIKGKTVKGAATKRDLRSSRNLKQ